MERSKYCIKCHERKTASDFTKNKNTLDGLGSYCKQCQQEYIRKYTKSHATKMREYSKKYRLENNDKIVAYRQRTEVKERERKRYESAKYKDAAKQRYLKNRDTRLEYARKYYTENKDIITEKGAERRKKLRAGGYYRNMHNNKMSTDKIYAKIHRRRNLIGQAFRRGKYSKDSVAYRLLGADYNTVKSHLLDTWKKNYHKKWDGEEYQIDHIEPLSTAETEEDVDRLFYYKNLQMLTPADNAKKGKMSF